MHQGRRPIVFALGVQALVALGALVAMAGQRDQLRDEILGRGPLSDSGLTRREFDAVVDAVYLQGLVVFAFVCLASLVLCWGMARRRSWAPFWSVTLGGALLAYGIAASAGDLVAGRARPALLGLGITGSVVLALLRRLSRHEKSEVVAAGGSVASAP
jgi:hypothetical protein